MDNNEDANQDAHLEPVASGPPEEAKGQDEPTTKDPETKDQPDLIQQAKEMIWGKQKEEEAKNANPGGTPGDQSPIDPLDPLDKRFLVPLPEKISINRINSIGEVKTVWKKGVRELE